MEHRWIRPSGEELSSEGLLGLLCAPFTQRGNPKEGFTPKAANDGLAGALTQYKPLTGAGIKSSLDGCGSEPVTSRTGPRVSHLKPKPSPVLSCLRGVYVAEGQQGHCTALSFPDSSHKSLPAPSGKEEGMPGCAVSLLGCPHPIPVLSQAFHVQPCHLEL